MKVASGPRPFLSDGSADRAAFTASSTEFFVPPTDQLALLPNRSQYISGVPNLHPSYLSDAMRVLALKAAWGVEGEQLEKWLYTVKESGYGELGLPG